jgi:molecular chaperone GrpE
MIGTTDKAQEEKRAAEDQAEAAEPVAAEGEIPSEALMEPAGDAGTEEQPSAGVDLAARLAAAEAEIAQLREERLRALAETENVRRRATRDRADASKYAVAAFARDLLSVADNIQRALGSVDPEARQADPALEALVAGVEMTEKELLAVFERNGISPIEALGQPFDPHFHEAMYEVPDESVPAGTVAQVIQPGYMIHERSLRAAGVGVSRGGPKLAPQPVPDVDAEAATSGGEPPPTKGSTAAYEKQAEPQAETSGSHLDEKF